MWLTVFRARKENLNPLHILDINLLMIVFGIVGSRLLHVFADGHFYDHYYNLCFHPDQVPAMDAIVKHCYSAKECGFGYLCDLGNHTCHPPRDCLAVFKIWQGGFAYYGGFLLAAFVAWLYTRRKKISFWKAADLFAPAGALGLFFGRIGCFLNGCCYGKITNSFWGVVFPIHSLPWKAQATAHQISPQEAPLPIHPTQLYEAFGCLALFFLLFFWIRPRKKQDGQVFGAFLILYGVLRTVCEFFRDDDRGAFWNMLSTSQLISIPLVIAGLFLWLRKKPLKTSEFT